MDIRIRLLREVAHSVPLLAIPLAAACGSPSAPGEATGEVSITAPLVTAGDEGGVTEKKLDISVCAPGQGGFSLVSTNAYFPMHVGRQWVLEGEEDDVAVRLRITVLDETEIVAGVTTRVIEEAEWQDDELTEVSRNFFVEAGDGTACYYGEDVDIYENGQIVSHEGAWRADEPGNAPGIFMPAAPRPGMRFQQEVAPGVAQDEVKIVGVGPVEVPAGAFAVAIRFREFNPLDGEKDYKVYAAGVGTAVDGPLELTAY